ncbi:MAG: HK97 family phage prohead protease [Muribaculaceae bacterium]|nr:HK97 family phage prohead protease [Muribaculaceae bacterium]
MKRERRNITSPLELRAATEGDSRHIEGYALVFNTRSEDLGGFTEVISPEAVEGVLERSDVMALLNHDINRGVLARFRNGGGSLKLEVDDKGLRYSFDAPNTQLGDEVLEGVKRGDITGSSFAFTVEAEEWQKEGEGYLRTIKQFGQLFDVSPVYNPAYLATSVEVDSRGLDAYKESLEKRSSEESKEEEEKDPEEEKEEKSGEEKKDEGPEETKENKDNEEDRNVQPPVNEDVKKRNNNQTPHKQMKKEKFSLLRAIRSAVENQPFDDAASYVIERGRDEARKAGVDFRGSILLPLEYNKEQRFEDNPNGIIASQTPAEKVAGMGGEVVPTELFDILGPLYDQSFLSDVGARMLNLTGNVEIPLYSGVEADWASEIETAKEVAGKFKTIKMSPKRIAVSLPISKQFLIQTSPSAEALIRQDLIKSISNCLQATILGDKEATDTRPEGLMHGVNAETGAFNFQSVVDWEADLESAKITGEKKYVISPRTKALMRTTKIDAGSGLMVMQNNEVLGVPAISTGFMKPKGVILGDWSNLYVGSFGAVDIVVDPYTRANKAQIVLHVNAWFDYVVSRPEAFVKKVLK